MCVFGKTTPFKLSDVGKMFRFSFLMCFVNCFIQKVLPMNQRDRDWGPNPTVFNIGGVLSNNESEKYFNETISVSKIYHFSL